MSYSALLSPFLVSLGVACIVPYCSPVQLLPECYFSFALLSLQLLQERLQLLVSYLTFEPTSTSQLDQLHLDLFRELRFHHLDVGQSLPCLRRQNLSQHSLLLSLCLSSSLILCLFSECLLLEGRQFSLTYSFELIITHCAMPPGLVLFKLWDCL